MIKNATVIEVMIGCPSDVKEEKICFHQAIHVWNSMNTPFNQHFIILPRDWQLDVAPELKTGASGQSITNERLLEKADILIAVFWTKLGTPTDAGYVSGTAEEIMKQVAAGKITMVYFSKKPVCPDELDQESYAKLKKFKEDYVSKKGFWGFFESTEEFQRKLTHDLTQSINQHFSVGTEVKADGQPSIQAVAQKNITPDVVDQLHEKQADTDAKVKDLAEQVKQLREERSRSKGSKRSGIEAQIKTKQAELSAWEWFEKSLQTRDPDEQIKCYTQAIKLNPEFAEAFNNRGVVYADKGLYDQAIDDCTRALEINPKDALAFNNRGNAYFDKGLYDQAIEDYTRAIKINPKDALAFYNRGLAYAKKGLYDQAIDDYSRAIEINPKDADVFNNRGNAYSKKGLPDQAIEDYNRAIKINPKDADVFNNRGIAYSDKGLYDQAIKDYNRAIEINPKLSEAFNNRGNAYSKFWGLPEQAIEDYNRAIEINPKYVGAFNNRGNAYRKMGQYQKALEDCNRALEIDPTCAMALCTRGETYYQMGQYTQALHECERSLLIDLSLEDAHFCKGQVLVKMGDIEGARQSFKRALELGHPKAQAELDKLKES